MRNNGDLVLQLAVMSFLSQIIGKCMGQWQCTWGQMRVSDNKAQTNNRLRCSYSRQGRRLMTSWRIREGNSNKLFTFKPRGRLFLVVWIGMQKAVFCSLDLRVTSVCLHGAVPLTAAPQRGGLMDSSPGERRSLSLHTSAEGEYSAACQITKASHSMSLFTTFTAHFLIFLLFSWVPWPITVFSRL